MHEYMVIVWPARYLGISNRKTYFWMNMVITYNNLKKKHLLHAFCLMYNRHHIKFLHVAGLRNAQPQNTHARALMISVRIVGHAHLTDFNIATRLSDNGLASSFSGTKPYMAPEVFMCALDEIGMCVLVE